MSELALVTDAETDSQDYHFTRDGRRVDGDPLAERRTQVRGEAYGFMKRSWNTYLPALAEMGYLVERTSENDQARGIRRMSFAEPVMHGGKLHTLEVETPVVVNENFRAKLTFKSAPVVRFGEQAFQDNHNYTSIDLTYSKEYPNDIVAEARNAIGGHHYTASVEDHNENSMYRGVSEVAQGIAQTEQVMQALATESYQGRHRVEG